jgi:hypothetical protein
VTTTTTAVPNTTTVYKDAVVDANSSQSNNDSGMSNGSIATVAGLGGLSLVLLSALVGLWFRNRRAQVKNQKNLSSAYMDTLNSSRFGTLSQQGARNASSLDVFGHSRTNILSPDISQSLFFTNAHLATVNEAAVKPSDTMLVNQFTMPVAQDYAIFNSQMAPSAKIASTSGSNMNLPSSYEAGHSQASSPTASSPPTPAARTSPLMSPRHSPLSDRSGFTQQLPSIPQSNEPHGSQTMMASHQRY